MRNQDQLEVRKLIIRMGIGQSETITCDASSTPDVEAYAKAFAKNRGRHVSTRAVDGGVLVTRLESAERVSVYPELDALDVGQSHLFELPTPMHQRIRQAASFRNKAGEVRLSCITEGAGIRVTRLPITEDEREACGAIPAPARASRWGLERLATGDRLTFNIEPSEHHKLRLAATFKMKQTGWTIRCRLQDDGTMLVYRTDNPAIHPDAQPPFQD